METRKLGTQGLEAAEIGLGCMGMSEFYGQSDEEESIRTITRAPRRGSHRPLLPAPGGHRYADRGDRRRDGRARGRGQGPLPRAFRGKARNDQARALDAPDQRAPDRVLAVDARPRGPDPSDD